MSSGRAAGANEEEEDSVRGDTRPICNTALALEGSSGCVGQTGFWVLCQRPEVKEGEKKERDMAGRGF